MPQRYSALFFWIGLGGTADAWHRPHGARHQQQAWDHLRRSFAALGVLRLHSLAQVRVRNRALSLFRHRRAASG